MVNVGIYTIHGSIGLVNIVTAPGTCPSKAQKSTFGESAKGVSGCRILRDEMKLAGSSDTWAAYQNLPSPKTNSFFVYYIYIAAAKNRPSQKGNYHIFRGYVSFRERVPKSQNQFSDDWSWYDRRQPGNPSAMLMPWTMDDAIEKSHFLKGLYPLLLKICLDSSQSLTL